MPFLSVLKDSRLVTIGVENFQSSSTITHLRGTQVFNNATANTKSEWAQITGDCPIEALGAWIDLGRDVQAQFLADIAIGVPGSEKIILSNFHFGGGVAQSRIFLPFYFRKGERIVVRHQCDTTGSGQDLFVTMNLQQARTCGVVEVSCCDLMAILLPLGISR